MSTGLGGWGEKELLMQPSSLCLTAPPSPCPTPHIPFSPWRTRSWTPSNVKRKPINACFLPPPPHTHTKGWTQPTLLSGLFQAPEDQEPLPSASSFPGLAAPGSPSVHMLQPRLIQMPPSPQRAPCKQWTSPFCPKAFRG